MLTEKIAAVSARPAPMSAAMDLKSAPKLYCTPKTMKQVKKAVAAIIHACAESTPPRERLSGRLAELPAAESSAAGVGSPPGCEPLPSRKPGEPGGCAMGAPALEIAADISVRTAGQTTRIVLPGATRYATIAPKLRMEESQP